MKFKKILFIVLLVIILFVSIILLFKVSKKGENSSDKIKVVASNFASYDFLRAIIGDTQNVKLIFLLGPGKEAHSYEPTASDLILIQQSDLFVYIGGEMENWTDKILEALNKDRTKSFCIADFVDKLEEEEIDGAEEEHEEEHEHEGSFNEHIWTSTTNAIKMVEALELEMEKIDTENSEKYNSNAQNYILEIQNIKEEIQKVVNGKKRNRLVFGDKMPMQYFMDEFNLEVSAAFNGCSTEVEPSAATVAYLINIVRNENIPVILYCELNTGDVARTIAREANNGAQALQIQTLHNVTQRDFDNKETWVTLMERNIEVLKKSLQ